MLPENRLFQILKDLGQERGSPILPAMVKKIASQGRVNHIITGSFARAGDMFRVNIQILDPISGEYVDSGYSDGQGVESFFAIVDQLTRKVKTRFNIPWQAQLTDIDREISKITTSSTEALQHYIMGKHLINLTRYEESVKYFKNATNLDPNFGMAFRGMGWAYAYMMDWENRRINFEKTMNLLDYVSDRERYLIEGTFYGESEATFQKSLDAFKQLLKLYPDDCEGNEHLGINYQFLERWDEAVKCLETNRKNQCLTMQGSIFLSYSYLANMEYEKALKVLDETTKNYSDNALIRQFKNKIYISQNKFDLALVELEKAAEIDPQDYRFKIRMGDICLFKNNLRVAEEIYLQNLNRDKIDQYLETLQRLQNLYFLQGRYSECIKLVNEYNELVSKNNMKEDSVISNILQSYMYLKMNKSHEAMNSVEEALKKHKKSGNNFHTHERLGLYLKALIQINLKQFDNASKILQELKKSIESSNMQYQMKYYYHGEGEMAINTGNYRKALDLIQNALSHQSNQMSFHFGRDMHAIFYGSMVKALVKLGKITEVQKIYEKIINLNTGWFYFGDIYVNSFYHRAKIFQDKGWEGKAIEHYEQFLELRGEADSEIKEVADARKQLARLTSK